MGLIRMLSGTRNEVTFSVSLIDTYRALLLSGGTDSSVEGTWVDIQDVRVPVTIGIHKDRWWRERASWIVAEEGIDVIRIVRVSN